MTFSLFREDLYQPKRGIALGDNWTPRLPDIQLRKTSNLGACQDGNLTKCETWEEGKK